MVERIQNVIQDEQEEIGDDPRTSLKKRLKKDMNMQNLIDAIHFLLDPL